MAKPRWPLNPAAEHQIKSALEQVATGADIDRALHQILDNAISLAAADIGMVQLFDAHDDSLRLAASRGFSTEARTFFATVRRNTNSTCAAALTRRMQVFVGDVSTSYLFVGTRELEMLRTADIAAAHSTPLISSRGQFCGVITMHFRTPQSEDAFDRASIAGLARRLADCLAQRESAASIEDPRTPRSAAASR